MRASRLATATCAALVATSLGGGFAEASAVDKIGQYCRASWVHAGIARQDWPDCTQQTLAELLNRISRKGLVHAITQGKSPERRELNRSIWCTVQRWRRAPRCQSLDGNEPLYLPTSPCDSTSAEFSELHDWLESALTGISLRQRRVLRWWSQGQSISEIAQELGTSPARVSDEKYKALQKIRRRLKLSSSVG